MGRRVADSSSPSSGVDGVVDGEAHLMPDGVKQRKHIEIVSMESEKPSAPREAIELIVMEARDFTFVILVRLYPRGHRSLHDRWDDVWHCK